jgi:hypothetical protein
MEIFMGYEIPEGSGFVPGIAVLIQNMAVYFCGRFLLNRRSPRSILLRTATSTPASFDAFLSVKPEFSLI